MKTIIAGTRTFTDYVTLEAAIQESGIAITEVVSGGARGVDSLGERWAKENDVPVKRFLPNWDEYGKAAGPIRNSAMAEYADALIAIWDDKSVGTSDMIAKAEAKGLKVYVKHI